jgi:hypothetical protein
MPLPNPNRALPLILGLLLFAAGPAWAMAPIQDYLETGRAGERDHAYPLMRCGALYMSSLKVAGADVTPEKAENVMQTAMKMIAIGTSFRMKVAEYDAQSPTSGKGSLVNQDFKYCRNFAEPFARNYNMDPPQGAPRPVPRETPLPKPPPQGEPAVRPGDVPGAPLPH